MGAIGSIIGKVAAKSGKYLAIAKAVSPELCLIGSIVCGVACVVTACMATVKSEPVVAEAKEKIEDIKHDPEESTALVTEEQAKEIKKIKVNAAVVVAKNYIVPAVLGALSIGLNILGNRLLRRMLAAMSTAFAALLESYNEYRKRVIEDQGAEKDQEYYYGIKRGKKEIEVIDENGNVSKKLVDDDWDCNGRKPISRYARWFNEGDWDQKNCCWKRRNWQWKDDPDLNWVTVKSVETEANGKLHRDGFLFLNDVYFMLGLPKTVEGQLVGWTVDGGDGCVSFGIFDPNGPKLPVNKAFANRKSPNVLIDFNVDGPIIGRLMRTFGDEYAVELIKSAAEGA